MKFLAVFLAAALAGCALSVEFEKFKNLTRGTPRVVTKNLNPTLCVEGDDTCQGTCTCQDFDIEWMCFSDPLFEEELSKCTPCDSDADCTQATDACFIPDGLVAGYCDLCVEKAMFAGVNSCAPSPSPSSSSEPSSEPTSTAVSEPSAEASPTDSEGIIDRVTSSVCFPHDATVMMADGSKKMMKDVAINDKVQTGQNKFSTVFSFTHRDAGMKYRFVQLSTAGGRKVQLTGSHFIYANGELTAAKNLKVGDLLVGDDGSSDEVSSIELVSNTGLYNPQTIDGDIVVDGVVSSTYTDALQFEAAHTLLAPLRMLYRICGVAPLNREKSLI